MSRRGNIIPLLGLLLMLTAGPAGAESWVRAAGGLSHMAMGDVNGATFNFYEEPGAEATFADVGKGFLLDLSAGTDLSPAWGLGFHWERQWAGTTASDQGVDGELDLDANFFLARAYWTPVRRDGWSLGLAAGTGYFFAGGGGRVTRGTVNYGEGDLWGTGWSLDGSLVASWRLRPHTDLQVQVGARHAVIGKFEYDKRVVLRQDGSQAELDYSGWQVRAGVRWTMGDAGESGL
jgi:hypothetical protein